MKPYRRISWPEFNAFIYLDIPPEFENYKILDNVRQKIRDKILLRDNIHLDILRKIRQ